MKRIVWFITLALMLTASFTNVFAARYYDPQIARWTTPDPADEFYSPYVYVGNMPIIAIDPNGENVEVIIGKSYTDSKGNNHPYGHMALRVFNDETDVIYDFGRYRRSWGLFDQYGEGILNIRDSDKYISSEQSIRNSIGFQFKTTPEQDQKILSFFNKLVTDKNAKLLFYIDQKTGKRIKLSEDRDYHWSDNNCVTITLEALKQAGLDIDTYKPFDALEQVQDGETTILPSETNEYKKKE